MPGPISACVLPHEIQLLERQLSETSAVHENETEASMTDALGIALTAAASAAAAAAICSATFVSNALTAAKDASAAALTSEVPTDAYDDAAAGAAVKAAPKATQRYRDAFNGIDQMAAMEGLADLTVFSSDDRPLGRKALKAVGREIRRLSRHGALEFSARASIFVRYDEDRPQFMRALITGVGPDTPYAHGLFLFDIFLPPEYPQQPPIVTHVTPGATNVEANNGPGGFSPNLHKDTGKVCLSLLGTWGENDWKPESSNLYQVLSTILWGILGAERPYYMEPDFGGWEGTAPVGDLDNKNGVHEADVIEYDRRVQVGTVKFCMLGPLKQPHNFAGFENIVRRHFAAKRSRVMKTLGAWIKRCDNEGASHKEELKALRKKLIPELEGLSGLVPGKAVKGAAGPATNATAPTRE